MKDRMIDRDADVEVVGYLRRWALVSQSADMNVYLHNILAPDPGDNLHDHPWSFQSTVLRGGYTELTPEGEVTHVAGDTFAKQATDLHRIIRVEPDTWTLLVVGAIERGWGFMTPNRIIKLDCRGGSVGAIERGWGFMTPNGWEHFSTHPSPEIIRRNNYQRAIDMQEASC